MTPNRRDGSAASPFNRSVLRLPAASWPLMDQAIVSLGTFVFNIVLARNIPLSDYGHYAMALGILLLMQAVSASLIFYPLSVYAAVASDQGRRDLVLSSLLLTSLVCVPMTLLLGLLISGLIDGDLLLPCCAVLLAGQLQEALRRSLLSEPRHERVILGDGLRYIGQVAILAAATHWLPLDLPVALFIMAASALAGAGVQYVQSDLGGGRLLALVPVVQDFWRLGKWSLTSNVLGIARTQCIPWLLGMLSGPAAAGAFQIAMNIINLTTPVIIGICNVLPQMAARALPEGYRAAWQATWPLMATGGPIILVCSAAMLVAPNEFVTLFYGAEVPSEAIAGGIRVLAASAVFAYASSVGCAFLHGVGGGRDGLMADLVSTGVMLVLALPLTIAGGLAGGCAALAMALIARSAFLIAKIVARLREEADDVPLGRTLRPSP